MSADTQIDQFDVPDLRGENDAYPFFYDTRREVSEAKAALRERKTAAALRRQRKMVAMVAVGGFTAKQVAERFGVSTAAVAAVVSEYNEKNFTATYVEAFCEETGQTRANNVLTVEQVKEIKEWRKLGYDKTEIARYYGVSTNAVTGALNA